MTVFPSTPNGQPIAISSVRPGWRPALVLIGILYAVPLYVFSSLFVQGRRSLPLCIGVSAAATAMIYLLFAVVLRLELYPGILFGGA